MPVRLGRSPAPEAMLTIRPKQARRMDGAAACASQNAPSGATEIGPDGPLHGVTWRQLAPASVVSQTPEIGTKASHASPETAKPWMGSAPPFG